MRITGTILILLSCSVLQGCLAVVAVAAAGVGYDQPEKDEVSMDVSVGLGETWRATLGALQHLGYPVPSDLRCGEREGEIDLEESNLRVRVERLTTGRTRVRVRFGASNSFNHEHRSNIILEAIRRRVD